MSPLVGLGVHPYAVLQPTAEGKRLRVAQFWQSRLYFGYGDTANNTGPIQIAEYNPDTNVWADRLLANTEAIYNFRIMDTVIRAPFADPRSTQHYATITNALAASQSPAVPANFIHCYDAAGPRMDGALFLCGQSGATGNPMVSAILGSYGTSGGWQAALAPPYVQDTRNGVLMTWSRFGAIGILNDIAYTSMIGGTATSAEQDGGFPSFRIHPDNTTDQLGPVFGGFVKPINFNGRLVYRTEKGGGDLRSFDGTDITGLLIGPVADHYAENGILYAVVAGHLLTTTDFVNWTDVGTTPDGVSSLAVLDGVPYYGTNDSAIWTGYGDPSPPPPDPSVYPAIIPERAALPIDVYTCDDTGNWIQELTEVTVEKASWRLNEFGLATISTDPLSPNAVALSALNAVEVQIWLGEELAWWGIPRRVSGDLDKLTFECESLLSEFLYVFLTTQDLNYLNLDQKNIVANLVNYAQSLSGQDRNIVVGAFTGSGIIRERNYLRSEYPNIYELIKAFPNLKNGLDYALQVFGDGRREFTMYYPEKGSYKPQYALELDQFGRKYITGLAYNKDAAGQANDLFITGGINEWTEQKMVGRYTSPDFGAYGRRQQVLSEGEIYSQNWLDDRAEAEGIARGNPMPIPDIVVSEELYGLIEEGDRVPVRVDYGAIQMIGQYRINEIEWTPGSLQLAVQPA